jgi:hypothetical protein
MLAQHATAVMPRHSARRSRSVARGTEQGVDQCQAESTMRGRRRHDDTLSVRVGSHTAQQIAAYPPPCQRRAALSQGGRQWRFATRATLMYLSVIDRLQGWWFWASVPNCPNIQGCPVQTVWLRATGLSPCMVLKSRCPRASFGSVGTMEQILREIIEALRNLVRPPQPQPVPVPVRVQPRPQRPYR